MKSILKSLVVISLLVVSGSGCSYGYRHHGWVERPHHFGYYRR